MMESLPQTGGKDAFNTLRQAGFSLPTITEFIKRKIDAGLFISALRECLYREFKFRDVERIDDGTAGRFVEDTDKCNPTLVAVYNLAVLDRPDGLTANPKVHAIVNFNLDALLEQYDKARHLVKGLPGKRRCIHTIESPSHDRIFGRVNIYHPHGYLRFDRFKENPTKEAIFTVLSEHEFFDFYNRSTEIFTYTMLFLLREYHCLFVGMSMTDDNIGRLLFYSNIERQRSREREKRSEIEPLRHSAIMRRPAEGVHLDLLETTLKAIGVQPMWIDSFSQIPEALSQLSV